MALGDACRAASHAISELTERVKGLAEAQASIARRRGSSAADATLADAIKRGQAPELIAALKKALGT